MYHDLTIAGRCGSDPDMKYTPAGKAVAHFSVAVDKGWGENKRTIWFRVTCWQKTAEAVNQYLRKGQKVLCVGELEPDDSGNPRTFQRQDGSTGASYELSASTVRFLSGKDEGGERQQATSLEEEVPF